LRLVGLRIVQQPRRLPVGRVEAEDAAVRREQEAALLAQRDRADLQVLRQPLGGVLAGAGIEPLQRRTAHVHPPEPGGPVAPQGYLAEDVGGTDDALDVGSRWAGHGSDSVLRLLCW